MNTLPFDFDAVRARSKQQYLEAIRALPNAGWPEDRFGVPNAIIRCAIFGLKRRSGVNMLVAGAPGYEVTVTGWRLDQSDLDIYLHATHLLRQLPVHTSAQFSISSFLRAIGRSDEGKANHEWLKNRLRDIAGTIISYDGPRYCGTAGSLLASFHIDKKTKIGSVSANYHLRPLWEDMTYLSIEERLSLGRDQLAKAFSAMLFSHVQWTPMLLSTLAERIGADISHMASFKREVRDRLEDFRQRGWIHGYEFKASSGGCLLHIDKRMTPSQQRHATLSLPSDPR